MEGKLTELEKRLKNLEERVEEIEKELKIVKRIWPRKKGSILDHILTLKKEGFFSQPRSLKEIRDELAARGYYYPLTSLTHPLFRAVRKGILRRIKERGRWVYVQR